MPEGQFTGSRVAYDYTSDTGQAIQLVLDETMGSIGAAGLSPSTSGGSAIPKPTRFEPRGVYWQGELSGKIKRKFIVCNAGAALYASNVSQALTVDGVARRITGRRGETMSFVPIAAST